VKIAFHPIFGQSVPYRFDSLPSSADSQVEQTIQKMLGYIRKDAASDLIADECAKALQLGNGDPIAGTWKRIKGAMKFQSDEVTAGQLNAEPEKTADTIEVLIRPVDQSLMIRLRGVGIEDCDGFEMFAACLFLRFGIPCSLVTVAASGEDPSRFSHVYLAAYPEGFSGPRIPLDFSHGEYPGWECPNHGRIKEWPVQVTAGEQFSKVALALGLLGAAYFGLRLVAERENL
jgi:hypothetical protein